MSWAKESADAGIAGLSEWEAARGVLGGEVDVDAPDVEFIKAVSNSITRQLTIQFDIVGDVGDVYLKSTFNLGTGRR